MATYSIDYYKDGWKNLDKNLPFKIAYKLAKRYARAAKRFSEMGDIVVTHEQCGHIVLEFDAKTRELVYVDLN